MQNAGHPLEAFDPEGKTCHIQLKIISSHQVELLVNGVSK